MAPRASVLPSTCPPWCAAEHDPDDLIPDEHGEWGVTHTSTPHTGTSLDSDGGVLVDGVLHWREAPVLMDTSTWTGEQPDLLNERVVRLAIRTGCTGHAFLTARQALHLAELLMRGADALLEQEDDR